MTVCVLRECVCWLGECGVCFTRACAHAKGMNKHKPQWCAFNAARGCCCCWCFAAAAGAGAALLLTAQDDAAAASWFDVTDLPPLAFDHKLIIREALEQLAAGAGGGMVAGGDGHTSAALREQLLAGARALAGPWTPPQE